MLDGKMLIRLRDLQTVVSTQTEQKKLSELRFF